MVDSAANAVSLIRGLQSNPTSRAALSSRIEEFARLRTSRWAADVFCAQLEALGLA